MDCFLGVVLLSASTKVAEAVNKIRLVSELEVLVLSKRLPRQSQMRLTEL